MIKFPRYSREQSLNCKLSNNDIEEVKRLRELGFLLKDIGKRFQVNPATILYWLLTPQERKDRNKRMYIVYDRFREKEDKRKRQVRSMRRKRKLMPVSFRKYRKQF